jgi:hypothetical protein
MVDSHKKVGKAALTNKKRDAPSGDTLSASYKSSLEPSRLGLIPQNKANAKESID